MLFDPTKGIIRPYRIMKPAVIVVAAGGEAWNPSDKVAAVTLSNSDLTMAGTNTAVDGVRSLRSHSTGKYHQKFDIVQSADYTVIGCASAAHELNAFHGFTAASANEVKSAGSSSHGFDYFNGVAGPNFTTWAGTKTVAIEFDFDNSFWRVKNVTDVSAWSTNRSLSGLTDLPWFLFGLTYNTSGNSITINPDLAGATSGFGAW